MFKVIVTVALFYFFGPTAAAAYFVCVMLLGAANKYNGSK